MSSSSVEELALSDLDRSNKGASKQRRDLINAEIAIMRDLLPLTESARQRLSQLQVMSLSCVFIRKCNVLRQLFSSLPVEDDAPKMCDFSQALTGFLLITTREGKLVYISENVTDYLGHSMVDMKTQGDSLYDIVDKRDEAMVRAHLLQGGAAEPDLSREVAFFCRMNMSRTLKRQSAFGDVKVMHVRGHFLPLSGPSSDQPSQQQQQKYVFMATCSPLVTPELKESLIQSNTLVFKTVHKMDMTFLEVTKTAEHHLGGSMEEICKTSWYSMLHPEDIHEAREKHVLLMRASHEVGCMMTVRLLTLGGSILWVNVVMQVCQSAATQSDDSVIVCINQVISEEEGYQIRMQSHMFALYPPRTADLWRNGALSPPQPVQTDPVCWMPATSSSSPSSSIAGMPNPMMPCLTPHPRALPTGYIRGQQATTDYRQNSPSSPQTAMLSSSGHTDKLKLMLKRKLQGPSKPAKVPKMAWDETSGTSGISGNGQNFERSAATSPQQSSQLKMNGNVPVGYSWSGSTQVISQASFHVAQALSVPVGHQQKVKGTMAMTSPSQGSLSPPLSTVMACQSTEQVVPQGGLPVTVSLSASSPGTEASSGPLKMKGRIAPASAAVLKDLEKLPTFIQEKNLTAVGVSTDPCIKTEQSTGQCRHAGSWRELPIMDASDIKSFFDTLDFAEDFILRSKERKQQWQVPLPETSGDPKPVPNVKAAAQITQIAHVKQEVAAINQGPFPACQQQQQIQKMPEKAEQPQQSEVDFKELEELLSFFSGDMTATQLNLDSMPTSPGVRGEGEELDSSGQHCDNFESQVCGAGHLDHFLLSSAGFDRPTEGFSPVSSSDLSGDDDCSSEETVDRLSVRREDGEKHGSVPSSGPSPPPFQPQTPEDVTGISEEDELYQLDKLLSLMASDNGVMLSLDSQ
ncbi:uncharacterized protein LOC143280775 [Babylonia areolata]|uniref:uncharacterized protein LOC143280775 n=1 Tax=Babylonia areolata TaxID=304850 RepID=UPI003FD40CA2